MRILCFGDSNTYGYDPRSPFGDRYPPQYRWLELLGGALNAEVINGGENGREIPRSPWEMERFAGLLRRCMPLERLILLLGTNDLLQTGSAAKAAERMETFLTRIPLDKDRILLLSPPPMEPGTWVTDSRLPESRRELTARYADIAANLGISFADCGGWGIKLAYDGVHFTQEGHRAFAVHLAGLLRTI